LLRHSASTAVNLIWVPSGLIVPTKPIQSKPQPPQALDWCAVPLPNGCLLAAAACVLRTAWACAGALSGHWRRCRVTGSPERAHCERLLLLAPLASVASALTLILAQPGSGGSGGTGDAGVAGSEEGSNAVAVAVLNAAVGIFTALAMVCAL